MGLLGQRYNVFMTNADRYAAEIKRLDEEIANDPYNTELLSRRKEMVEAQRESIIAANEEKYAIKDLVKQGIDIELDAMQDLIDKYNESLDTAKDLYDYQKKVSSQAKNIADIQKQLAAYSGDLSEENRARVQKLQVSLQEAQDKLQETEYQQYITDQKKLLGDLYDDYEETLNSRLDDIDVLVSGVIDSVNENSANISGILETIAMAYGYNIGTPTSNLWNGVYASGDGALSMYGYSNNTGANNSVMDILRGVVALANNSDAIAGGSGRSITIEDLAYSNPNFRGYSVAGSSLHSILGSSVGNSSVFGDTNVSINIDHVDDYNDFVNKLREDPNFDRMIRAMTTDRLMGGSSIAKTKYKW